MINDYMMNPYTMLLNQIKLENPTIPKYGIDQYLFRNITFSDVGEGNDTSVEFNHNLTTSTLIPTWVTMHYKRGTMSEVFSEVIASGLNTLHETMICDDAGLLDIDKFYNYMIHRYSIKLNHDGDLYDISYSNWILTVTAKAHNPAFTGSVSFDIGKSLRVRVEDKELVGFEMSANYNRIGIRDENGNYYTDDGLMVIYQQF